jgi:hypothetical protein
MMDHLISQTKHILNISPLQALLRPFKFLFVSLCFLNSAAASEKTASKSIEAARGW